MASCTRRRSCLGALRDASEMGRQPALDLGFDLAGEDRRGAFRADGDDNRIAIDDRRHDEVALRWAVDHVDGQAAGPRRGGDARVELWVVAGGKDQRRPVEVGLGESMPLDEPGSARRRR